MKGWLVSGALAFVGLSVALAAGLGLDPVLSVVIAAAVTAAVLLIVRFA